VGGRGKAETGAWEDGERAWQDIEGMAR
jgi:hypothetical protein